MAERRPRVRSTYHHGDLRAALITAGVALARDGGPQAVVLREVARAVGVAPNSAYGPFSTLAMLKRAVAQEALRDMGAVMNAYLDTVPGPEPDDRQEAAKAYLQEVGRAYVRYALTEPGLFRMAMGGDPSGMLTPATPTDDLAEPDDRPKPDSVLLRALTRLIEVGYLRPEDTGRAVAACWATVHGLSIMLIDLLPQSTPDQQDATVDAALDVLVTGLTARRA